MLVQPIVRRLLIANNQAAVFIRLYSGFAVLPIQFLSAHSIVYTLFLSTIRHSSLLLNCSYYSFYYIEIHIEILLLDTLMDRSVIVGK